MSIAWKQLPLEFSVARSFGIWDFPASLVKRSRDLRGRNSTRDSQVEGASKTRQASEDNCAPEAFCVFFPLRWQLPAVDTSPYWKLNTSGKITTTTHAHTAYTGRYAVCHRSSGVNPTCRRRNLA